MSIFTGLATIVEFLTSLERVSFVVSFQRFFCCLQVISVNLMFVSYLKAP